MLGQRYLMLQIWLSFSRLFYKRPGSIALSPYISLVLLAYEVIHGSGSLVAKMNAPT